MWIFILNLAENELCILCLIMENYIIHIVILLYLHSLLNKPDVWTVGLAAVATVKSRIRLFQLFIVYILKYGYYLYWE